MLGTEPKKEFLHDVVKKNARKYGLEGLVQNIGKDKVKIVVCGELEQVNLFIDILHKEIALNDIALIEIEPFLKDKDYRGVFRVIE